MSCSSCIHWNTFSLTVYSKDSGQCKRYPPVFTARAITMSTKDPLSWTFPTTEALNTCGEYTARQGGPL